MDLPEWCVYQIQSVDDPVICEERGIILGGLICVATCPFLGDPVDCQPNAPDPKVDFRVIDNGCTFNAVSLDRCEPCVPGAPQFRRIN